MRDFIFLMLTTPVQNYEINTRRSALFEDNANSSNPLQNTDIQMFNYTDAISDDTSFSSADYEKLVEADKEAAAQTILDNQDVRKEITTQLDEKIKSLESELEAKKANNGIVGSIVSFFGGGTSSEAKKLNEYKELLVSAKNDPAKLADAYEKIMGQPLSSADVQSAQEAKAVNEALTVQDKQEIVEKLKVQADELSKNIDSAVGGQGCFSWLIGKANNAIGIGTTENQSRAQIEAYQNKVNELSQALKNGDVEDFAAKYKDITGEALTVDSLTSLADSKSENNNKVSNSKAATSVNEYKDTQQTAKKAVIGTVVAIGATTAALALAPFTGGASIVAGIAIAGAIGAGGNVALNAIDGFAVDGSGYNYSLEEAGKDAITGAISGATGYLSAGGGAAIAKGIAGPATKQIATTTAKQWLIKTGTQVGAKFVGDTVTGVGSGAVIGASNYIIDCATTDKEFNWSEFGSTTGQSALWGGITAGAMSLGTSAIGIGVGAVKNNVTANQLDKYLADGTIAKGRWGSRYVESIGKNLEGSEFLNANGTVNRWAVGDLKANANAAANTIKNVTKNSGNKISKFEAHETLNGVGFDTQKATPETLFSAARNGYTNPAETDSINGFLSNNDGERLIRIADIDKAFSGKLDASAFHNLETSQLTTEEISLISDKINAGQITDSSLKYLNSNDIAALRDGKMSLDDVLNRSIEREAVVNRLMTDGMRQGTTGDCHLLSTIDAMMNNPNASSMIESAITETSDGNYLVKIGDKTVEVAKNSIPASGILSDVEGIRILEEAYKKVNGGNLDGGFADEVAKQFGLDPVHITKDSLSDEMLKKIATGQENLVLSAGFEKADGTRHYLSVRNIDTEKGIVTLVDPTDTSIIKEMSLADFKKEVISLDGGSLKGSGVDLPNSVRPDGEVGFYGGKSPVQQKTEIQEAFKKLSEDLPSDIGDDLLQRYFDIGQDDVEAMKQFLDVYNTNNDDLINLYIKSNGSPEELKQFSDIFEYCQKSGNMDAQRIRDIDSAINNAAKSLQGEIITPKQADRLLSGLGDVYKKAVANQDTDTLKILIAIAKSSKHESISEMQNIYKAVINAQSDTLTSILNPKTGNRVNLVLSKDLKQEILTTDFRINGSPATFEQKKALVDTIEKAFQRTKGNGEILSGWGSGQEGAKFLDLDTIFGYEIKIDSRSPFGVMRGLALRRQDAAIVFFKIAQKGTNNNATFTSLDGTTKLTKTWLTEWLEGGR